MPIIKAVVSEFDLLLITESLPNEPSQLKKKLYPSFSRKYLKGLTIISNLLKHTEDLCFQWTMFLMAMKKFPGY